MLGSKQRTFRILKGQVMVNGAWVPFSTPVSYRDAFTLASDIADFRMRHAAAISLEVHPTSLPMNPEENAAAYRRLAPKIKELLANPSSKKQRPIDVTGYLRREDFRIMEVIRIPGT